VGIEALQQGAAWVTFVESSKRHTDAIRARIHRSGLAQRASVITRRVIPFIHEHTDEGRYDIIFLDPPYHSGEVLRALYALSGSSLPSEQALIIAEHSSRREMPEKIDNLSKKKDYIYGDTTLSLYVMGRAP